MTLRELLAKYGVKIPPQFWGKIEFVIQKGKVVLISLYETHKIQGEGK